MSDAITVIAMLIGILTGYGCALMRYHYQRWEQGFNEGYELGKKHGKDLS